MESILLIIIIIVTGGLLYLLSVYNGLIGLRNRADEAWSGIDTQLKRRYDLIPNLVETVKGYAKHEEKVFTQVTEARTQAMGAQTADDHAKAENMLSQTLKSLFAVAENYPELKANENFMHLQQTLNEIEEEINKARRFYNGVVRDYNTKLQVFPNNLVVGIFGFTKKEFFGADEEEKKNVKVDFSGDKKDVAPAAQPAKAPATPAPTPAPAAPAPEAPKVEEAPKAPEAPKVEEAPKAPEAPKEEAAPAEEKADTTMIADNEPAKEEAPKAEEAPAMEEKKETPADEPKKEMPEAAPEAEAPKEEEKKEDASAAPKAQAEDTEKKE